MSVCAFRYDFFLACEYRKRAQKIPSSFGYVVVVVVVVGHPNSYTNLFVSLSLSHHSHLVFVSPVICCYTVLSFDFMCGAIVAAAGGGADFVVVAVHCFI